MPFTNRETFLLAIIRNHSLPGMRALGLVGLSVEKIHYLKLSGHVEGLLAVMNTGYRQEPLANTWCACTSTTGHFLTKLIKSERYKWLKDQRNTDFCDHIKQYLSL